MTALGDVVGVEVVDAFNPDEKPTVHPGFVVNIQQRPKGEDGPDVVTVVTYDGDGNQTVRQVSEGAGLTSLSGSASGPAPTTADLTAGQADTETVNVGNAVP